MNIMNNRSGFTLLEIIITSVMISIILLGIITSNLSLQKNTHDAHNIFYVAASTQDALDQILKDASLAVTKDNTNPGMGIGTGTAMGNGYNTVNTGDANSFCFYQYDAGNVSASPQWACYTWNNYNLYRCIRSSAGTCSTSSPWVGKVINPMVDTAYTDPPSLTINSTQSGQQKVIFRITLESCIDPSLSSCCDPAVVGCSPDLSNPYVKKEGSVSPPGISGR